MTKSCEEFLRVFNIKRPLTRYSKRTVGERYLLTIRLRGRRVKKNNWKKKRFVPAIYRISQLLRARDKSRAAGKEIQKKNLQTNNLLRNLCSSIHRTQINICENIKPTWCATRQTPVSSHARISFIDNRQTDRKRPTKICSLSS